MLIHFNKMHAQGNDFLILNAPERSFPVEDLSQLSRDICDRRFGIGGDGLVLLSPEQGYDARMTIYNSDGSRAMMCGSALRCVSLMLSRALGKQQLSILTDSGKREAIVEGTSGKEIIRVSMGTPRLIQPELPVGEFTGSLVDVGNLHYVIWTDDLSGDPHLRFGSLLEHHPAFPEAVNVHFVRKVSATEIQTKIWEKGAGATLACGTGATAAVCSGIALKGLENRVLANMPGGTVQIERVLPEDIYYLSGEVFETGNGTYIWKA